MKKLLSIGVQSFSKLRENNYIYVDKTELIYKIMTEGNTYFLSRPRRFGKSMTLSTLKAVYQGRKELFGGLWIEDKWDWTRRNPVIHIPFSSLGYSSLGLENALKRFCHDTAMEFGISLEQQEYNVLFDELIKKTTAKHGKVVLLIDEYDKPIIDYLEDLHRKDQFKKAHENRAILRQFYACIKDNDENIELFFMTGVSKFSQTGIFSHLNHLNDLTMHEAYCTLVGYTQEELVANFDEYLDVAAKNLQYSKDELVQDIKTWYNGYSWDGIASVYNPYSVLLFLSNRTFESHWFRTGSPKFLIDIIKNTGEFDFNQLKVNNAILDSYEIENLNIRTLMFQTGYLTVKSKDARNGTYVLDYPNREVEQAMSNQILAAMTGNLYIDTPLFNAHDAFMENDMERIIEILNAMIADIPNPPIKNKVEYFYHSLIHVFFRYMGFQIESEVNTIKGRLDAVVTTETHVYIFEFKIKKTAQVAFQQILDKKYADKYRMFNKTIIGLGVNFDTTNKCIDDWKIEEL
jgi:hypothetical protein